MTFFLIALLGQNLNPFVTSFTYTLWCAIKYTFEAEQFVHGEIDHLRGRMAKGKGHSNFILYVTAWFVSVSRKRMDIRRRFDLPGKMQRCKGKLDMC